MTKKKSVEDRFFPVATIPRLNQPTKPIENQTAIKKIIQGAIQGAYQLKTPSDYDLKYRELPKTLVTEEQVQFVSYLIESLQPQDAIEATLASQYVISYLRGLDASSDGIEDILPWFKFGHEVLETLAKYKAKGALVNFQYNQSQQINNFQVVEKKDDSRSTIEVDDYGSK